MFLKCTSEHNSGLHWTMAAIPNPYAQFFGDKEPFFILDPLRIEFGN